MVVFQSGLQMLLVRMLPWEVRAATGGQVRSCKARRCSTSASCRSWRGDGGCFVPSCLTLCLRGGGRVQACEE